MNNETPKAIERFAFTLLPPHEDLCQTCAMKHDENQPHNAQSFYYQTKFNLENARSATWEDAMAHCPQHIKSVWREELIKVGVTPDSMYVNLKHKEPHPGAKFSCT